MAVYSDPKQSPAAYLDGGAQRTDNSYMTIPVFIAGNEVWPFAVPTGIKQIYPDAIMARQ